MNKAESTRIVNIWDYVEPNNMLHFKKMLAYFVAGCANFEKKQFHLFQKPFIDLKF